MNNTQKAFLDEFSSLLKRYNVSDIYIEHFGTGRPEDDRITFLSNDKRLKFSSYNLSKYYDVSSYEEDYEPQPSIF